MTSAQKSALLWLRNRGGDGVFADRGNTFLARGEIAPVMRSTWNKLVAAGLLELYGAKRMRETDQGAAVNLRGFAEAQSLD